MSRGFVTQARRKGLRWFSVRARALRAFSFPVSVLPVFVVTAAVRPLGQWRWDILAASAVGVALLHAVGNLLNDYFDFRFGVDRKVEGDEGRPGRLLVRGELTPKELRVEAAICLLLSLLVTAYLTWKCGPVVLVFGSVAVFALYAYTGPPIRLKYHALGEPLIFLVFGPLLFVGAAYAQTGRWELPALLLSIPVGFTTTAILVGNNIRDDEEDRDAEIVTLTQVVGARAARLLYVLLIVGSVLGLAILGVVGLGPRALSGAPLLLILIWGPLVHVYRGGRLPNIDFRTARFESALLIFLLVVAVIGGGIGAA